MRKTFAEVQQAKARRAKFRAQKQDERRDDRRELKTSMAPYRMVSGIFGMILGLVILVILPVVVVVFFGKALTGGKGREQRRALAVKQSKQPVVLPGS